MDINDLRKILIHKSLVDDSPPDEALLNILPKEYVDLVRTKTDIKLKESLWFNYEREGTKKAYWIYHLYGINEISKEKKILDELCIDHSPYNILYELDKVLKVCRIKPKKLFKKKIISKSIFEYLDSEDDCSMEKFNEIARELYYNDDMLKAISNFLITNRKVKEEHIKKVQPYIDDIYFTKSLIPIGTSDGHTQVCFIMDESESLCGVYFVDHEFCEHYKIADDIETFFRRSYFKRNNYCFEVTKVDSELVNAIDEIIRTYFDETFITTLDTLHRSLEENFEGIYRVREQVGINLKPNQFHDASGVRENHYDEDITILTIMPRGCSSDMEDLTEDEIDVFNKIYSKINQLDCVRLLHRFGNEYLRDMQMI